MNVLATLKLIRTLSLRRLPLTLSFALISSSVLSAQVVGASLSGIVTDPAGAYIVNSQITAENQETGIGSATQSSSSGSYSFSNLQPGRYNITVQLNGFAKQISKDVVLTVGDQRSINFEMTVGVATETVIVTTLPANLDLDSSTVSGVVGSKTIRELPLNGRDWTQLATLQPGVLSIRAQASTGASANRGNRGFGDQLSDNGHRPTENTYRVNGINTNDYSNGSPGSVLGVNLGVDAIEEFSVLINTYPAEYGRTSGAVVNAITKSGTNTIHGSAYGFLRDHSLDTRNYFDKPGSVPPFHRTQFGGSAGGPIIKNRTFIFGDYEGVRQNISRTFVNQVPSDSARAGLICSIPVGSCTPTTVAVNPLVKPFLALWPRANGPSIGNGDSAIYNASGESTVSENYFIIRLDHKISGRDALDATYMFDKADQNNPDSLVNTVHEVGSRRQLGSIEESHTFNPNVVNSIRLGYNRVIGLVNAPVSALNPAAGDPSLAAVVGRAAPSISIPGITGAGGLGTPSAFTHAYNSYQAYDDAFITRGKHSIKFGFAFERMHYNLLAGLSQNGGYTFSSLSNFLTNQPQRLGVQDPHVGGTAETRQSLYAGYLQDDWRLRPGLIFNVGLRYEMTTLPTENHGRYQVLTSLGPSTPVPVKTLWATNQTLKNFEPRLGFAWDPIKNEQTVLRGAFGLFDVLPLPYLSTFGTAEAFPFSVVRTTSSLPAGAFPTIGVGLIGSNNALITQRYVDQNPKRNYVMNWNLDIQQQLSKTVSVSIGYAGSRSIHQAFGSDDINTVVGNETAGGTIFPTPVGSGTRRNPLVGQIRPLVWNGDAYYDALETQIKTSPIHGITAQASYTWGKCIDTNSSGHIGDAFQNSISALYFYSNAARRGSCDFDLKQNFVANYIWALPSPKGALAGAILGHWETDGIVTGSTGVPFTPLIDGDPLGQNSSSPYDYPDRVRGGTCTNPLNKGNLNYVNLGCFKVPSPITRFGNAGRNQLTGPGLVELDASVIKDIPILRISDAFRIQLRGEVFNVLNKANFQAPIDNSIFFAQDGSPVAGAGRINATTTTSRQIQLGAKVYW